MSGMGIELKPEPASVAAATLYSRRWLIVR